MSSKTLETKTVETKKTLEATLKPLVDARRAYIGLHGFAYDRAQMRRDQAETFVKNWFDKFVVKGEDIEAEFTGKVAGLSDTVKTEVSEKLNFKLPKIAAPKFTGKTTKVAELEAEIALLNAKLELLAKTKKTKAPAKKKAAKKVTTKTTSTKTVKVETTEDKYAPYLADVQRYDAAADMAVVRKIVNHCGIALLNNDGRFVACSDETERNTVRDSWLVKKLGIQADTAALDAKVAAVCETMKADNKKSRVTFYYLAAQNEGKLASL